ncbi:hypothetical protein ABVK25_002244 [Lepraria finkii]|uniref:Vacuolar sorting protein Vps3844 N-terminal domain-containing protein n=1 Tax=Lepraria finkii TaxID=1340010 RepID=A0ABR4BHA1_9LECA
MKLIAGLSWAGTALQASLVSAEALVYTSDTSPLPLKESLPSIFPNTARLLFAQRLGLSQYHSLEGADETTLNVLNTYGGKQQHIFSHEERTRSIDKILLIVDGVANPEDIFDHSVRPAVTIQSQPSTSQNRQLALDFLEQDQHSRSKEHNLCQLRFPSSSTLRGGLSSSRMESHNCGQWNEHMTHDTNGASQKPQLSMYKDLYKSLGSGVYGHTTILHVSTLQDLSPNDGERYTTALSDLKTFIKHFHQPNSHVSSTIVIMPANSKPAKRSITSPYGTYVKPLTARQQPEEPLSSPLHPTYPRTLHP